MSGELWQRGCGAVQRGESQEGRRSAAPGRKHARSGQRLGRSVRAADRAHCGYARPGEPGELQLMVQAPGKDPVDLPERELHYTRPGVQADETLAGPKQIRAPHTPALPPT